jgi:hypothetical protein
LCPCNDNVAPTSRENPTSNPEFPTKNRPNPIFFDEIEKKLPDLFGFLKITRDICTRIEKKCTKKNNMSVHKDTIFPRFATRSRKRIACSYPFYFIQLENDFFPQENHSLPQETPSLPQEIHFFPQEIPSLSSPFETNTDKTPSISREMKIISREMKAISREMETISREMKIISREMNPISREMKTVSREMKTISREIETRFFEYSTNNNVPTF